MTSRPSGSSTARRAVRKAIGSMVCSMTLTAITRSALTSPGRLLAVPVHSRRPSPKPCAMLSRDGSQPSNCASGQRDAEGAQQRTVAAADVQHTTRTPPGPLRDPSRVLVLPRLLARITWWVRVQTRTRTHRTTRPCWRSDRAAPVRTPRTQHPRQPLVDHAPVARHRPRPGIGERDPLRSTADHARLRVRRSSGQAPRTRVVNSPADA